MVIIKTLVFAALVYLVLKPLMDEVSWRRHKRRIERNYREYKEKTKQKS